MPTVGFACSSKVAESYKWRHQRALLCRRPPQRPSVTATDGADAGALPCTDDSGAEAQPSAAAAPENGSSGSDGDHSQEAGPRRRPATSESTSDESPASTADEEDAAALPPIANGRGPRLANGHADGAQQSAAERAQPAGRPPDAALAVADRAVQPEQQRPAQQDSVAGADVFIEHERDPAKARALESSLWEVASLRNHYCPHVRPFPMCELQF